MQRDYLCEGWQAPERNASYYAIMKGPRGTHQFAGNLGIEWQLDGQPKLPFTNEPVYIPSLATGAHTLRLFSNSSSGWSWSLKTRDSVVVAGPFTLREGAHIQHTFTFTLLRDPGQKFAHRIESLMTAKERGNKQANLVHMFHKHAKTIDPVHTRGMSEGAAESLGAATWRFPRPSGAATHEHALWTNLSFGRLLPVRARRQVCDSY